MSQSVWSRRMFAESKSASLYRQTFLALVLIELFDFHLREQCIPLWSDVPNGGITSHDDNGEVTETSARCIRDVLP